MPRLAAVAKAKELAILPRSSAVAQVAAAAAAAAPAAIFSSCVIPQRSATCNAALDASSSCPLCVSGCLALAPVAAASAAANAACNCGGILALAAAAAAATAASRACRTASPPTRLIASAATLAASAACSRAARTLSAKAAFSSSSRTKCERSSSFCIDCRFISRRNARCLLNSSESSSSSFMAFCSSTLFVQSSNSRLSKSALPISGSSLQMTWYSSSNSMLRSSRLWFSRSIRSSSAILASFQSTRRLWPCLQSFRSFMLKRSSGKASIRSSGTLQLMRDIFSSSSQASSSKILRAGHCTLGSSDLEAAAMMLSFMVPGVSI
mmetsp:Transcript_38728/g.83406  ORF Transcript_38728/g.83406 Transcript_38728/m.83406 type:complete len:324 (-) Transcript_38728:1081-2052(-)